MKKLHKLLLGIGIGAAVLGGAYYYYYILPPAGTTIEQNEAQVATPSVIDDQVLEKREPEVVVEGLSVPWEIAFLPTGEMLVTERDGRIVKIANDRKVYQVEGVTRTSEGGLLGLVLHPNFMQNSYVYIYKTTTEINRLNNIVERYRLNSEKLEERKEIFTGIPGAAIHDGGRMVFGPDGMLYIATGDANRSESAQVLQHLHGKILRLTDEGMIPSDNPFPGSPVYTLGHRNPQGLAWDEQGRLWSSEHGRSGVASGYDEINMLEAGKNYGWPTIQGPQAKEGLVSPVAQSGASTTWAPGGLAYYEGNLYFTGLRGEALYRYTIESKELTQFYHRKYGRLRAVTIGEDGFLYFGTSNKDGRGSPKSGDDKILRIEPKDLR